MKKKYKLNDINSIEIKLNKPCLVFLYGDLGAGKTTLTKHIFNTLLDLNIDIKSPTYTYYNKYDNNYHFDLYRLNNYDEFYAIGGEEILDNNSGIIVIEWPNIIEKYFKPDIIINIYKTDTDDEREIEIEY